MASDQDNKYNSHIKTAWKIYVLLAIITIAVMVLFVAQDDEEMFFYGLMATAISYVFRPTEKFMKKQIARVTGVSELDD